MLLSHGCNVVDGASCLVVDRSQHDMHVGVHRWQKVAPGEVRRVVVA